MKFAEMTFPLLREVPRDKTVVVAPIAACEQHSRHLPTFTDTILVTGVAEGVEAKMPQQVLLLPTQWMGASHHHLRFGATLSLHVDTHVALLCDLLAPLLEDGYQRLLLLNGHGGNIDTMQMALRRLQPQWKDRILCAASYWDLAAKELAALAEAPRKSMGHACEFETSMVMALRPELVRREQIKNDPPNDDPVLRGLYLAEDMKQRTDHGCVGYPESASAEKGRRFLDAAIARTAEVVAALTRPRSPDDEMMTMKSARLLLIGCCIALGVTGASAADDAKSHWAFQPVRRPALPAVKDGAWPRTSVDRFILAKLEEKGLKPSPTADRRTLIRRATFDLLGLPPTPEEVAAFESDPAPDAYERLIDRLLASPHYGERWGRYWLDVGRYADTKGYVFFEEANFPWAWTYRDYVIRAFNDDLPYDRFILEQLAADKLVGQVSNLPLPGQRQVGNLPHDRRPLTALGFLTLGSRFMNNAHDIIDDRIDVVTRGLLGLTVGCARCHDHKYDPITQRDYYALYGVFASCAEPTVPPLFADPPDTKEYAAFAKELAAREAKLTEFVRAKHDELVKSAQVRVAEYLMAAHAQRDQPTTEEFMLIADGADLNPTMIVRYQKYLERTRKSHHPIWVVWHALADLPEKDFAAKAPAVCAALAKLDPAHPVNPLIVRVFADKPPKTLAEAARLYGELLNQVEKIGSGSPPEPAREELRQAFHAPDAPANVALLPYGDLSLLPDRPSQAKLQELRKAVEQWRATGPGAPPRAMVLVDLPKPYEPHVFRRGNPNNLGEAVPRQFLEVLSGPQRKPFTDGSGRLELAKAIVSKDNPLTARVLVNRLWLHHFGRGLVTTPSDFGMRSDPPSHPELLDHLAAEFMDGGWSIKAMHRLITLSAAYRQRDDDRPECRRIDPENALVWRMVPRRLDFEATRDALLAASGRLSHAIGGPSMNDLISPAATRRTLYGHLDRLNVPGLYRTFDFPSPDATSPQRDTTTVAPQALFLMNHPFSVECARRMAHRPDVVAEKDTAGKVTRLYRILYGRAPKAEELRLAEEYLGQGGDVAWARYAQALLMSNEFVFVD